ncbi:uncharacterized protein NPIL_243691 [Nephila pilipes]|uniref:Uncharacterized protein n=1 Tax=Nephila pilipes TaxID=299642 RepID=A0A8X6TLE9_NEPPI|nr:uncharacterized protein NPIL_243691 [Nephila pilipes]
MIGVTIACKKNNRKGTVNISVESVYPRLAERDPIIARQLTLRKINYSPNEMAYITRMRNAIKFQIASEEDCNCFKNPFTHMILYKRNEITELRICLDYALSKVVKSHVLLHNSEPFHQWRTITIDNDGFFQIRSEDQRIAEISKKSAKNE